MVTYLLIALHKLERFIKRTDFCILLFLRRLSRAKIIDAREEGVKVSTFKEPSIEHVEMPKVFGFLDSCVFDIRTPEIALMKYSNSLVFAKSDFLITEHDLAIWPKYFAYNFSKNIFSDKFLYTVENGCLLYRKTKVNHKYDTVFSLLGVHDNVWAHALSEYFPKLYVLKNAIDDSNCRITVLVPHYKDSQLHELFYSYLNKYDVDIVEVDDNAVIYAKTVYYLQRPTYFTDHEVAITIGDDLHPQIVANILKDEFVKPYCLNTKIDINYKRVFLPRRGGLGKGLINGDEIEAYFRNKGFVFIEPHKVSLQEKIKIFQSAEIIVGPSGSAMTNLILCRPGTKVLIFSNYYRLFESYFCMAKQYFDIDIMYVNGIDAKAPNPTHCSYYIPINKVKEAAKIYGI